MPLPVESLTRESSPEAISEAISESIRICVEEGERPQDQCEAIAHSIARKLTGQPLTRKAGKSRKLTAGP